MERASRTLWGAALVASCLTAWPLAARAQGGPPLETDDPGTPGNRRWEVNTALTLERTSRGTFYEAPLGDANYGLGNRVQLKIEVPFRLIDERGSSTRAGLGNPLLGMKWRFLEDSTSHLAVCTYPQLELRNPLGSAVRDAEEDRTTLLLPLELATGWWILGVDVEVGYRLVQHTSDELIYGLALGSELSNTLELLSECNGVSARSLDSSEVVCQLGAREALGHHFSILGAVGTAVIGDPAERPKLHIYLGLQSRW